MAQGRPTDGYHERLGRALREGPSPMSVRQLGEALGARHPGRRGFTYGGIRQYLANKVKNPRLDVLRAAADELGVRPEWLAFDDGEMTVEREAAQYLSPALKDWFAEGESGKDVLPGTVARFGDLPDAALHAAWKTLTERHARDQLAGVVEVEGFGPMLRAHALYRQTIDAVFAPLNALDMKPDAGVTPAVQDYVTAVALAVRQYLRATRQED
jgi:transcriptional regulator with XRE-family HTH domain